MNSLIIANNAPGYFRFFTPLAEELSKLGEVIYALDSVYSKKYNQISDFDCHVFSEFCERLNFSQDFSDPEDLALAEKIQNEYGTWFLYPDADRDSFYNIFSKRCQLGQYDIFLNLVAFFISIFKNKKIDYIFYENASNALALIAREVGRHFGAIFIGISISRLPGRIAIVDRWEQESEKYLSIFKEIQMKKIYIDGDVLKSARRYLDNIEEIQPDYMKNNFLNELSIVSKYFNIEKLKILFLKFSFILKVSPWDFQIGNPFEVACYSFCRNFKRRIKSFILKEMFEDFDMKLKEEFYLYPLHFHPEASTSLLAREYGSEFEVIRNIAYSLPYGTKLYVKDHLSAYGYPSLNFYRKLKMLPNVKLISPFAKTKSLIKNSLGVITLTSTVGYEALLLKKPVIVFGNVFYDFHRNCFKLKGFFELEGKLKEMKLLKEKYNFDDGYNLDFALSYFLGTVDVAVNYNDSNVMRQSENAKKLLNEMGFIC